MLTQEEIQKIPVSRWAKLGAMYTVVKALEELGAVLRETIYDYMPMSLDEDWQDEADKVFWNSEAMEEINEVDCALIYARDLALHAINHLECTPHSIEKR